MKLNQLIGTISLLIICGYVLSVCSTAITKKKKIVYINSYHVGHPSSDEIMNAVLEYFPADSFEVRSFLMDTKRNPSIDHIQKIAASLYDSIQRLQPDILIVSDDNAVKYVVQPNVEELGFPVVFCGVNGSAQEYHLPPERVTGMLEILPVEQTLSALEPYFPDMKQLLVLSENTTTSRKEKLMLDTVLANMGISPSYALVDDFESWKLKFLEGNELFDIIYFVTNGAIKDWNRAEALDFVREHITIPVFTCEDFMMPYAVFGKTKAAKEQGLWAGGVAKEILNGKSPADFPVTQNQLSATWLNQALASKIDFYPDTTVFDNIQIVTEDDGREE